VQHPLERQPIRIPAAVLKNGQHSPLASCRIQQGMGLGHVEGQGFYVKASLNVATPARAARLPKPVPRCD
jgi:hypothetical protein